MRKMFLILAEVLQMASGRAPISVNRNSTDLEFLVTSRQPSHADRIEIDSPARK
jgi:hypothetical protein